MKNRIFCPSMMCADFGNLAEEIQALEAAGSDMLHLDIMDGQFVPNFGMGLQDVEFICRNSQIPSDVHLMIHRPGDYVERFAQLGAKIIYIHPEGDIHPARTLQKIQHAGAEPGIAINPGTSVATVLALLPLVRYVLVMTVNPGFAGQQYIISVDEKIQFLLELREKYGFQVVVDGACSPERIRTLSKLGVNGFVLGTSALFGKGRPYAELMQELRKTNY